MFVQDRGSDDPDVLGPRSRPKRVWAKTRPVVDSAILRAYPNREPVIFSPAWLPGRGITAAQRLDADVIHLHWINAGFLSIEAVGGLGRPTVWTLHDMWAMTGGCHYAENCRAFEASCGQCPRLHSSRDLDLSRFVVRRKARSWSESEMTIVTPSHWLAREARSSSVLGSFPIEVIPNGVDTNVYKPIDRTIARRVLGIESDRPIVLFGAVRTHDRWKGARLLQQALAEVLDQVGPDAIELVTFGAGGVNPDSWPFPIHHLGTLNDDVALALAYSSADVAVVPSTQEAFGNVALEAMSCGVPCVVFAVGGLVDIVQHGRTGYVAEPFVISDLAAGILWALDGRRDSLGDEGRRRAVSNFDERTMASRYLDIYRRVIDGGS